MELEDEAARRVGTTLKNKWTLERLIGTGGMAAVYVARHEIGRRDAIKILHADIARDKDLCARFKQEARAANRIHHPGAVEVRDSDVAEDGSPFLVMELLEGQSLSDMARQPGGVPLADLLRVTDELLDVLAAAHAVGIIHRDIKPDNLFVLKDGRLKVLDFGIARVRATASSVTPKTRLGATLGTAPYMPPEQIRGIEIDARADLFAVGATLFRLIAKRRIHEAASEAETLVKMASIQAPPLLSVAPDAPRDVALVVDRALMFERDRRYPDALTMQSDVRALRAGKPPPYATALAARDARPAATDAALVFMPPSSDRITHDAPTMDGQTRMAGQTPATAIVAAVPGPLADARGSNAASVGNAANAPRAPASSPTAAASPVALTAASNVAAVITAQSPSSAAAPTPGVVSSAVPTPDAVTASAAHVVIPPSRSAVPMTNVHAVPAPLDDPGTHRAMMVLGAAGLGAPLASSKSPAAVATPALAPPSAPAAGLGSVRAPEAAPPPSSDASVPTAPAPPQKIGDRTLRSEAGPEIAGASVEPQGYSVAPASAPRAVAPPSKPGPRTQVAGSAPMAPGESIPVVGAPPAPPRRPRTLPGTEIRVVPLVLVGVLFAAIGVGITLFFMLSPSNGGSSVEPSARPRTPRNILTPAPPPHTSQPPGATGIRSPPGKTQH